MNPTNLLSKRKLQMAFEVSHDPLEFNIDSFGASLNDYNISLNTKTNIEFKYELKFDLKMNLKKYLSVLLGGANGLGLKDLRPDLVPFIDNLRDHFKFSKDIDDCKDLKYILDKLPSEALSGLCSILATSIIKSEARNSVFLSSNIDGMEKMENGWRDNSTTFTVDAFSTYSFSQQDKDTAIAFIAPYITTILENDTKLSKRIKDEKRKNKLISELNSIMSNDFDDKQEALEKFIATTLSK